LTGAFGLRMHYVEGLEGGSARAERADHVSLPANRLQRKVVVLER